MSDHEHDLMNEPTVTFCADCGAPYSDGHLPDPMFVVTRGEYDGYEVTAVFSSLTAALRYVRRANQGVTRSSESRIEVFPLDPPQ